MIEIANGIGKVVDKKTNLDIILSVLRDVTQWDEIEDDRLNIKNKEIGNVAIDLANVLIEDMGKKAPESLEGKRYLNYGGQLKLVPAEKVESIKSFMRGHK